MASGGLGGAGGGGGAEGVNVDAQAVGVGDLRERADSLGVIVLILRLILRFFE